MIRREIILYIILTVIFLGCRKPKPFCNTRKCFIEGIRSVASDGNISKIEIDGEDVTEDYFLKDTIIKRLGFLRIEKIDHKKEGEDLILLYSYSTSSSGLHQLFDLYKRVEYIPKKKQVRILTDHSSACIISDTASPLYYHEKEFEKYQAITYYPYRNAIFNFTYGTILTIQKMEDRYIEFSYTVNNQRVLIGITKP